MSMDFVQFSMQVALREQRSLIKILNMDEAIHNMLKRCIACLRNALRQKRERIESAYGEIEQLLLIN